MNKIKEEIKDKYDVVKKKSKLLLHKAKIKYPKIFDSRYNKSFVIVSFIVLLGLITTASYATFVFLTSDYRAADIRFANLMYSMKIDNESTRTVTVNANSVTTYDIDLDALNEITSKYLVYYTSSNTLTNVKVEYSNLSTGRGEGNIGPTASRRIRIVVTNDSSSAVTLNFSVKGGYVYNNLSLGSGEYKIDGIFDEKSEASGDIVLRTYLNGKMVEEMPNYADMQANNYVYDETASACSNGAEISYTPTSTTAKLEITNVSGPTECAAVFHSRSDLTVTFIADNLLVNEAPTKESGYTVESATCNNNATISWDTTNWKANVSNVSQTNTNCVVKFKSPTAAETIIAKATEGNSEGLIKIDQPATGQTEALTEYRYSGSNDVVKNYVNFNNETWRIIGIFPTDDGTGKYEERIKIVREESIGDYSWDTSPDSINPGSGINQWGESGDYEGADLMRLLNPGYEGESVNNSLYWNRGSGTCYNYYDNETTTCDFSSTGLTENAKEMIEDAVWYTSASNRYTTASESYAEERASTTTDFSSEDGVTRTTNWTGKAGLMYPSDYGYASSGCRNGEQTLNDYDNETCTSTNWLYNSDYQWLLSPFSGINYYVRYVHSPGYVTTNQAVTAYGARPVIYLSSSVKITGGDGTLSSPYELEI